MAELTKEEQTRFLKSMKVGDTASSYFSPKEILEAQILCNAMEVAKNPKAAFRSARIVKPRRRRRCGCK